MMINFELIRNSAPALLHGVQVSLFIAACSCLIGFVLGTVLGVLQARSYHWVQGIVGLYTTIIRGTPMLMQILFMFYFLPAIGVNLSAIGVAIVAIGLNSGAYISQIIRSGISSVSIGQIEAAKVLGLSSFQTLWYIILPQALRIVVPTLGNELITLTKDSALASTIGVMELFKEGRAIIYQTLDAISILVAVGAIYLALTSIISILVNALEQRLNKPIDD